MKNIIFVVIDSLSYERVQSERTTPFLCKLMREHTSCERMYAQAPFTEAALMGLVCGAQTMTRGGYMMRYRDVPETFLETFAKAGYDVLQFLQPHIYPTSLERNLPFSYYNVCFDFAALWAYRLQYFADLFDRGALTPQDVSELIDLLSDNFRGWTLFLQRVCHGDERVRLIADNIREYDAPEILRQVNAERAQFEADPEGYLKTLLRQRQAHPLFKIPTLNQVDKLHDDALRDWVRATYTPLMERVRQAQAAHGPKSAEVLATLRASASGFLRHPSAQTAKDPLRLLRYYRQRRGGAPVMERIAADYDAYKAAPSMGKHFELFFHWLERAHNPQKPYLAYIHVDDIHNPEVFFSYDSRDRDTLAEQFERVDAYLQQLPRDYRGSITYDLALRYMDRELEKFVAQLTQRGLLQDAVLCITADHGFSFYDAPLRETAPNNFYRESYHVPCILVDEKRGAQRIAGYRQTLDIPATLLQQAELAQPETMAGKSLFGPARDYVTAEYMGGGCPDSKRRPIRYAIRNDRWNVVYQARLDQPFDQGELVQVFDLTRDPLERRNLYRRAARQPEVRSLLAVLAQRHEQLKESQRA
ncbi:MAG: sulfatase-like hydrolase/transferase [Christensenellales bacterium]|jgi:arylsulfatase A-like enzyme